MKLSNAASGNVLDIVAGAFFGVTFLGKQKSNKRPANATMLSREKVTNTFQEKSGNSPLRLARPCRYGRAKKSQSREKGTRKLGVVGGIKNWHKS